MKRRMLLGAAGVLALGACMPMQTQPTQTAQFPTVSNTYRFQPLVAATQANLAPAGSLTLARLGSGPVGTAETRTAGTVTGLVPNTLYLGRFHSRGRTDLAPCLSNGQAIEATRMLGVTDPEGTLILPDTVSTVDLRNAAYFNVYVASEQGVAVGEPVACAPLM